MTTNTEITKEFLDEHLDAILKASGSSLKNYSMHQTREGMRKALRAALEAKQQALEAAEHRIEDLTTAANRCINDALVMGHQVAQRGGSGETKPMATTLHAEAINALLSVATAAYDAMDNSEERANAAGGEDVEYIIQGNYFSALNDAMNEIDALPDDCPGYTLSGGARASWALRDLFTSSPVAVQPDNDYKGVFPDWKARPISSSDLLNIKGEIDIGCHAMWEPLVSSYAWGYANGNNEGYAEQENLLAFVNACAVAISQPDSGRDEALKALLALAEYLVMDREHEKGEGRTLAEIENDGELPGAIMMARATLAAQQGEQAPAAKEPT